jgi:hypothetical protein
MLAIPSGLPEGPPHPVENNALTEAQLDKPVPRIYDFKRQQLSSS